MKTSQKFALLLTAAGALLPAGASAQTTYTWNSATGGAFTDATNWDPQGVPTTNADTAMIDDVVGAPHSQTVTYDVGTLRSLGTLNLFNSAGAGFTDTLQLTSTVNGSTTTRLTVTNAITLGSAVGTTEIRISPTAASATAVLSDAQGLTVNAGGLVTLDASGSTTAVPIVNANTIISGGTVSVLGSSAAGGFGVNAGNANTLTLNSGLITFNAANASTTGRLQLFGNLTTTGGTITGSTNTTGGNQIELYGASNNIGSGTIFTNAAALTFSLRTAGQTLTSAVDLPNLLIRSGTAASPVNLVLTSAGQNAALVTLGTAAGYLKLGSNVNTPALPVMSITGSTLDLNGFALTSSITTGTFTPTAGSTITSSQANGTLTVPGFNFGTAGTANIVGPNVTVVATASPTGAANINSTAGIATYSPTSTLVFTGNSTSTANNRLVLVGAGAGSSIGNLQIGSGTSTTFVQIGTAPVNLQGNLSVLANSTLDLNTRTMTVAGKFQGTGAVTSLVTGGLLTFSSAGGLSPGFGAGNTGSGNIGTPEPDRAERLPDADARWDFGLELRSGE